MATPTQSRQLSEWIDPVGLCRYLGKRLDYNPANCDHTFKHTRACFAAYAPDVNIEDALTLLREMGASCDCEVGSNVCADIGG